MSCAVEAFRKPRPPRWKPQLHEQVFKTCSEPLGAHYERAIVWMVLPLVRLQQLPNDSLRPTGLKYDERTGKYFPLVRRRSKRTELTANHAN